MQENRAPGRRGWATNARIVASDLFAGFLGQLRERAATTGQARRIQTVAADIQRLPFRGGSFDLIWSEGAAYFMGFDAVLAAWRPLARAGGYLVFSELSWFRPDPPAEIRDYWDVHHPAMRRVEDTVAAAERADWTRVGGFHLPAAAWDRYYAPLARRLPVFRRLHAGDADAQAVADMTEQEMSLMRRYADVCGYEFLVSHRSG
jgi:ubiquinone/menaquinone biosynthesis C-methylase UbiE